MAETDDRERRRFGWKVFGAVAFLMPIVVGILWMDPTDTTVTRADRVLHWAYAVFAIGFAELFLFIVLMAFMGRLRLLEAISDKQPDDGRPVASLSRLQALLWTLVIITLYLHEAVTRGPDEGLPEMPSELLLVMGISGSVYLASKHMGNRPPPPPPPPPGGQP
jgi:hypothetical protein